ncbi:griselysin. Metallo peptidase. MEROPS family M04 [Actinomadura meyerae]|uniref:Neutral metalloproteinase n=1 Tax=Actinomadura meyerae TaxID=240840 RepID=A0A239BWT1_9ACTN|nr:M4 family metallopeptidase [Actinomadura meyerae]SNS12350.1 griselysin. Metallo peptidase. MEROPS family M04 [Actinomadura meyerae]
MTRRVFTSRRTALLASATLLATAGTALPASARQAPSPPTPQQAAERALHALAERGAHASAGDGQSFKVVRVGIDRDGTSHTRMTRTYNGLPVLGGDVVVHQAADGAWRGSSGTLAQAPADSTPEVTAKTAEKRAATKNRKADGSPALVVEARTADHAPRLAWRVQTVGKQADGTPSRVLTSVDAATGKVLLREEMIRTEAGDGRSLYTGTVPLETTRSGSVYQLKDPTRGGTYTGDAENQTDLCILIWCIRRAPATLFTDADNHWGSGTTSDRATVAVDAQFGTAMTWDFYKNVFGRTGIAGDGKGSFNRVHYGSGYANAFWDDSCFCMTYGDGDGSQLGPLTALDVAAHEMSHGVTSATANLTYSGESGGLNEATSDIMAAAVEFYANNPNDVGDYLVGEEVVLPGFGKPALRFMDRPSRDGNSHDAWSSSTKNLDVHYSSGVANHFFYLLSEGSGAKTINGVSYDSPTSNGSTITGIGRDAATKIWYRALTTYMTSSTNYKGARTATLSAAADLYGTGSTQYSTVAAAWSAVNVN